MTRNVRFKGAKLIDATNNTIGLYFTHNVYAEIILSNYTDAVDAVEDVEWIVNMHEAGLTKDEKIDIYKALAAFPAPQLDAELLNNVKPILEYFDYPYQAQWSASSTTSCTCRFKSKKEALKWARECAKSERQYLGVASFSVSKGNQIIYDAAVWNTGAICYRVYNGQTR